MALSTPFFEQLDHVSVDLRRCYLELCMVTDPTGRNFISYRRARAEDIAMLVRCQHEHGIPTWQDINDLGDGPTEDQITAVLSDPATASANLWLTPEVADSAFIKKVEAPQIVSRFDIADGFFVVAVAAGGLNYESAANTLRGHTGLHDLSNWNLVSTQDPPKAADVAAVTERTLIARVATVHRSLPDGDPVKVRLYVRQPAPYRSGYALSLDWSHAFSGRHSYAWDEHLLPALRAVIASIEGNAPGRPIEFSGMPTISAAVCLGVTCLAPRQLNVSWVQFTNGKEQEWSLRADSKPSGCAVKRTSGSTDTEELAVLISVADDVATSFVASRDEFGPFRAILSITAPGPFPHTIGSAGEAVDLVQQVIAAIRESRRELRLVGGVHLFMAVPVGVAMMLGQSLNTLGAVHLYEHAPMNGVGRYVRELTISPSD